MNSARRFFTAEAIWAIALFATLVAVGSLDSDPPSTMHWITRALGLAAFPAGIFAVRDSVSGERPLQNTLGGLGAAATISVLVLLLHALVRSTTGADTTLAGLAQTMRDSAQSWESRNDAAWRFYASFIAPVNVILFAAIGIQVGIWARYFTSATLKRALYWLVGLGLLGSGYAIWDTTYETVVLHTGADASFASFYTLLVPAGICAGLALPTLAMLLSSGLRERESEAR